MTTTPAERSHSTLHYIYDPLCGWCYGASPLLAAAGDEGFRIEFHGGGMLAGARKQPVTPGLRNFVMQHDPRVAQMTGQPFGDAYRDGLLRDATAVFDSGPPTTAMLAAESMGAALPMLARMQKAHFVEGRKIADREVLFALAAELGLDPERFRNEFEHDAGVLTERHFEASIRLLEQVGGAGFPTFAVMTRGGWRMLESGRFLGRVEEWREYLRSL